MSVLPDDQTRLAPSRKLGSRSYSLTGPDAKRAIERGLANAEWYHTAIPRQQMKELMKRSDMPALRDTAVWFLLLIASGAAAYWSWGTWASLPAFAVYGVFY